MSPQYLFLDICDDLARKNLHVHQKSRVVVKSLASEGRLPGFSKSVNLSGTQFPYL